MTSAQYQRLKPREHCLMAQAASGNDAQELYTVYIELTGRSVNLHCGACIQEMMRYLEFQMKEYERTAHIIQ